MNHSNIAFALSSTLHENGTLFADSANKSIDLADALGDVCSPAFVVRRIRDKLYLGLEGKEILYDDATAVETALTNTNVFFSRYEEWAAAEPLHMKPVDCAVAFNGLSPYCLATAGKRIVSERRIAYVAESPLHYFSEKDKLHICELYSGFDKIVCATERIKREFDKLYPENNKTVVLPCIFENNIISDNIECEWQFKKKSVNLVTIGNLFPNSPEMCIPRLARELKMSGYSLHWNVFSNCAISPVFFYDLIANDVCDEVIINREIPKDYMPVKSCDALVSFGDTSQFAEEAAAYFGIPVLDAGEDDLLAEIKVLEKGICGTGKRPKERINTKKSWIKAIFGDGEND